MDTGLCCEITYVLGALDVGFEIINVRMTRRNMHGGQIVYSTYVANVDIDGESDITWNILQQTGRYSRRYKIAAENFAGQIVLQQIFGQMRPDESGTTEYDSGIVHHKIL
jgi:hypothetical protein